MKGPESSLSSSSSRITVFPRFGDGLLLESLANRPPNVKQIIELIFIKLFTLISLVNSMDVLNATVL